jgi:hypothetical protein
VRNIQADLFMKMHGLVQKGCLQALSQPQVRLASGLSILNPGRINPGRS